MAHSSLRSQQSARGYSPSRWLLGTALAAISAPVAAQTVPSVTNDGGASIDPNAALAPADAVNFNRRYEIDIDGAHRVITFDTYDVAADVIVDYVNTGVAGQFTAVNRITGGDPSDIFGLIRADPTISVWLLNPDGITFGSSGSFSGASLLVSTLDFVGNDAALLAELGSATPSGSFSRVGQSGVGPLTIQNGAVLNATTGNIVIMSERMTIGGQTTAADGSVVLIGARTVTFGDIGSPLSFTINQGVRLNQNGGITVVGAVEGDSVVAAAGGQGGNIRRTILNLNSNASLTATELNGSIILATDSVGGITIDNSPNVRADIGLPGNTNFNQTRTLTSQQGGITIISDHNVALNNTALVADQDIAITAANDLTAEDTTIVTPGDVTLDAGDDLEFDASTTAIGSSATRADDVFVSAGDAFALGDVTAESLESTGTPGTLSVGTATLGAIDVTSLLDIDATGNLGFTSLTSTSGIDVTVTGANIIGGGDVTANSSVSLLADAITVGSVSGGLAVDIDATNAISFASVASNGNIGVASTSGSITGGDVNPGNAAPTGAAYFSVGGNDDLTLGNVNATILGSSVGNPLLADNITVGDVTTAGVIDMVARDGNLVAGTLRTDGVNIELTATGSIDLDAGFTTLGMGDPTTGNIGIYAGGDIGSNTVPQTLSAGFDVAVRSTNGDAILGDVFAGDDIVIMGRLNGGGTASFDSVTFFSPGTANSDHATFVVPTTDFVGTGITDPGAPGTVDSVAFVAETVADPLALPPNPGARVFTGQVMGSDTFVDLDGQRLALSAQNTLPGDLNNVSGDQVFNGINIVLANNLDINGNLIVNGENVTLGQNNQTRVQQVTGFIDIDATAGNITFQGDLTLRSNTDGAGAEGIFLTATGNIAPGGNDSVTLEGGTMADPSAIVVELGGNFAADEITALNLSVTDGTNTFAQGDITIGSVTTNQALALRSNGGNISVGSALVTDALAAITLAAGSGGNVSSDTSFATNGGNILISADGAVNVAQVTTNTSAPTDPVSGNVFIIGGGDVLVSGGAFAGEDLSIASLNGDVGASGTLLQAQADDDIRLVANNGDIFVSSLETLGEGPDDSSLSVANFGTANAVLIDALAETLPGSNIRITGANLVDPALAGSGEDGLVVRDFIAGSATLTAIQGDIRIGAFEAATGSLQIDANSGSVTGLANGWTPLSSGSTITAVGNVELSLTGTAVVGTLTAVEVTGSGIDSLTIDNLTADAVTLSAVNRLHIDSGAATSATLTTTGGTAGAFSQTGATPVTGYGNANLSADNQLTVSAGGAAQLGTLSADGTGAAISVTGDTVQVLDASTTNALGNIEIFATGGNLLVGTISSAGTVLLDKDGTDGEVSASGAVSTAGGLTINSESHITAADALTSTTGNIALTAAGDTALFTAQALAGTFTAINTANGTTGAAGDFSASLVRGQSDVAVTADGAIDVSGDPVSLAIPGFDWSIQSVGGAVALTSGDTATVFSGSADGEFGVSAGSIAIEQIDADTIDLDATTGTLALLDGDATGNIDIDNTGFGDSTIGDVDSTGGNVTIDSVSSVTVTNANADIGDVAVVASAGDVTVTTATTPGANGDVSLIASGNVDATTLSGGGVLTADAGVDATIASATFGALVDIDAGNDIAIGSVTGAEVQLDATNNITGLFDPASTADLVPSFGRGDVTSTTTSITANAGVNIELGTLDAQTSATLSGAGVDIDTITAGTFIDIDSSDARLAVGSGTAGTTIDLDKLGTNETLTATALDAQGNITADSSTGLDIGSAVSANGSVAVFAEQDANLDTGTAAGAVSVTSNTTTASGGTLTGMSVSVNGFAVDVDAVDAGTGGFDATADGGNLFVDSADSEADITLEKTGDIANDATDGLTANSLTADNDIILSSETFVDIGVSNAGNLLSIVSPDTIAADDLQSDGSIAINTGGDADLGAITSGRTIILLVAGDVAATSLSAAEDIVALAGGAINVTGFDAGDNVRLTAGTTLDLDGGSTSGAGADDATYVLDLALAGDTTQTASAITDGPADANDGDILLEAPDDFALSGAISANAGGAVITVRNLAGGSDTTSVGASGGFEISEAELNLLNADNVAIEAGDQNIALGSFAVDNDTGSELLAFTTSGDITISGAISGSGTGTLQIGQGEINANGLVDPATLTTSIIADIGSASVDFAGGVVDMRAVRIVFGNAAFLTLTDGMSNAAAAELLTDAASQIYIGNNTQDVFLQADSLRVAYSDFALLQNTAFSQGGGVLLNADAANSITELALELFSQGDDGDDSFAIFGEINGFFGRTAGVLPNSVINIGTLSPRELRVTQAQSRVNGCVIGSPDRGCLIVDLPPPEITTIDERQAQQLITTDDPSAFLNPLIGRGNEGLILDIAQVPLGIDMLDQCDLDDASCQTTEPDE